MTILHHGAVVRHHGKPPNLLVLRCLGDVTTVVSAEVNEAGMAVIQTFPTAELKQVFPHD